MTDKCTRCGSTKFQTTADAKNLNLLEEFQSGMYTCCQITDWAEEQWSAWFEATQQDSQRIDDVTIRAEFSETEAVLVPVRLRRPQVPWCRNPNHLG